MVSSKPDFEADVAIIGAGPAGAAAAVHLGQLGVANVLLVDRADFPRDKTCGSGLSPKGIALLKALGVWRRLEPHAYPITGLRLVTPGGREMMLSGGEAAAAVICARRILDETLVRRAEALGAQFVPDFQVKSLIEEGGRVVGFAAADGRAVRARYTLVADGGHSRLVLERGPRRILQAIMGWWEGVDFPAHHVEMILDREVSPYYGWLFPESEGRVNIGICYRDDLHEKNARALFQSFLDRQYGARLASARQLGAWKGHPILYSYSIDKLWSPGRVILGEAGRMVHPATGEGIYQGMRTGQLAAEAVRDAITGARPEPVAFGRYQNACRKAFLASFWSAKLFQKAIESPLVDGLARLGEVPLVKRAAGELMARM